MFRFSIRNAFRRKWVLIIAIVGTGLGCALMTVILSLSDGMNRMISQTVNRIATDIIVSHELTPFGVVAAGTEHPLPRSYIVDMEEIEHVEKVSPVLSVYIPGGNFVVPPGVPGDVPEVPSGVGLTFIGIDMDSDWVLHGAKFMKWDSGDADPQKHAIVGGALYRYGEHLVPQHLHWVFEMFSSPPQNFEVYPVYENPREAISLTWVGIFETGSLITDTSIYVPIETVRSIAWAPGQNEGMVGSIRVKVDSVDNVDWVASEIGGMFDNPGVQTIAAKDIAKQATEVMSTVQKFLLAIAVGAAVAGGLSILVIMLMSTTERRREFGILKASGWSNRNILLSVLIESVAIALMGFAFGLILGFGATIGINHYLGGQIAMTTPLLIAQILGFGVAMGALGGLYPAIRATRVSLMEALRAI